MRYTAIHDCPLGGCRTIFVPEVVTLDIPETPGIICSRREAEAILLHVGVLPHNFDRFIIGDPYAIDSEWWPPPDWIPDDQQ